MTRKHARSVTVSFAAGVAAAIAATLLLDYLYFERAVDAREREIRDRFRDQMQRKQEYYYRLFCEESEKARTQAEADAQAQYADIGDRLNHAITLNVVRQKMLDAKNAELRTYAGAAAEIARLESSVNVLEEQNGRLQEQLELASITKRPGDMQLAAGVQREAVRNSDTISAMRVEFARKLAAEAEGRKKPKGPVYLNTPRGRVVLIPAG